MVPSPQVLELPKGMRITTVRPEIHSKGSCYAAEDVRRAVLCVAQRMSAIQTAIEESVGEPVSLASLFESADFKLRKGRTGSFCVRRISPDELPTYLDEQRSKYGKVVIGAVDPDAWRMSAIAA